MPSLHRGTSEFNGLSGPEHGDARLRALAERRLRSCGYLALRDVLCVAHEGVLWLAGRLPSHYLRQVAHAVVAEIDGPRTIINLIEVEAEGRKHNERAVSGLVRWSSGDAPRGLFRRGAP